MRISSLFFILFLLLIFAVKAQDVQFSQFYSAPLYLNPAFAGSSEMTRVGFNFRNQWPSLDQTFVVFSAYADGFIQEKNSGLGLVVNGSRESFTGFQNSEIGLLYSYRLRVGEKGFLHMGIQVSYAARSASFDDIILSTQLDIDRGVITPGNSLVNPDERQRSFADLHSGLLYYNEKIWFGASAHHLLRPELSFLHDDQFRLPIKYSFHGGIKFDLESGFINDYFNNTRQERTVAIAFNYKNQGVFDQLDVGTEFYFEPIILGIWYRGLPTQFRLPNNEALIGLLGITLKKGLDIGYSYDFTLSQLGWRNSGGAHEVSVRYSFVDEFVNRRQIKRLPTFRY
ncbi:type IX secretion system membrane protein PorP/SprF [Belliella sp. DSM 107340]|uniref:Type IX secretion system membrane protein PorP/SprF n=1 Tax=Belliella calami TaxID=2923436 RepID=A0ABS9UT55_9BACT|nr:type IX secretion system membrane protein PorP/SprF [Belliella calami]MCH7399688.1 type IX secretion system membrane protein PorP/SprF [Belliella calami]